MLCISAEFFNQLATLTPQFAPLPYSLVCSHNCHLELVERFWMIVLRSSKTQEQRKWWPFPPPSVLGNPLEYVVVV